ncbi:MAG TPA: malonyl-CoA decarboxylase family protein [Terriglobales bacterium]|nr:malonyl-CoA decarboxylase family protein [Terriglobales bacterium]
MDTNSNRKAHSATRRTAIPHFFKAFLQELRGPRGSDVRSLCRQLLSERGEASQTALVQQLLNAYERLDDGGRLAFLDMLNQEFGPDEAAISDAAARYQRTPGRATLEALSAAMESPRQRLFCRINTAPRGMATLVDMRGQVVRLTATRPDLMSLDADLKHLFSLWFNRGFLRLERIGWHTSALILEKLIHYESVHEINGWPDLRRRLAADRRCFAFFHPSLPEEPIIFVEVALTKGIAAELEPLLDVNAPVLPVEQADTAIFYSISNCLDGLRGISFGNALIKQVVEDLGAELDGIKSYCTLSPLPRLARALRNCQGEEGFTRQRLARLLADYAPRLTKVAGDPDPVAALWRLLEDPLAHRELLSRPLQRLGLAYLTQLRANGRPYDPVAAFHFFNGARLEAVNSFGNLRPAGLKESFGLMANYRYLPNEFEENHERFIQKGEINVSRRLAPEFKAVAALWSGSKPGETGGNKVQAHVAEQDGRHAT